MRYNCLVVGTLVAVLTLWGTAQGEDFASDLAQLRGASGTGDPGREQAIRRLSGLGSEINSTCITLAWALKADDPKIRLVAAEALYNFGPAAAPCSSDLIKALRDREPEVRIMVALSLSSMGPLAKDAVRPLLRVMKEDPDVRVRRQAISTLGRIGPYAREAVPALVAALNDPDDHVVGPSGSISYFAIVALSELGPDAAEAAPALLALAKDERDSRRFIAMSALGGIGPVHKDALLTLLDLIKPLKNDIETRRQAAAALGRLGVGPAAKEAVPVLVDLLNEEEPKASDSYADHTPIADARCAAARSLGQLGSYARPAVPALVQVMMDPKASARVNNAAIQALIALGPEAKEAVPALMRLPRGETIGRLIGDFRTDALVAIGKDAVPAVADRLKSSDQQESYWAVKLLTRIGTEAEGAVPKLRELSNSSDAQIKKSAEDAVKAIAGER